MPNENFTLQAEKTRLENVVNNKRSHLKFLGSELETIIRNRTKVLNEILDARREILKIDRKLK